MLLIAVAMASDGAFIPDGKHGAWQILAPLFGLYHVRGGHSAVLPRFVHFYLSADNGRPIPLNWVLSNATAQFIWKAFTDAQVCNATELKRFDAALAPETGVPTEFHCGGARTSVSPTHPGRGAS